MTPTEEPRTTQPLTRFAENVPGLLDSPLNKTTPRIFVAATRQNDGKTTTSLGLYGALRNLGYNVGYIKPVAQRLIEVGGFSVDEDTQLINTVYDVNIPIEAMSPIAVDSSFTRRYLDDPDKLHPEIIDRVCRAFDRSSYEKDIVIIEGSGHAGVGSVFDCSNAQNARLLGSKCIIVASGGIGKPVDEIAINKALFDQTGVECAGVILNKVIPERAELVRDYAGRSLARIGVKLLGVLPLRCRLARPNLAQVVQEIGGEWLHRPERNADEPGGGERVKRVIMGAMSPISISSYLGEGVLFILPGDRDDLLYSIIASAGLQNGAVAGGIILTNSLLPHERVMNMLRQTDIHIIGTNAESFAVTTKINNMIVKTQPEDTDKITAIEQLIQDNIDLKDLLARL
ncbi:MAG: AAA family ATPase [Puniceicoccales bacterium]|jgi:BioD-like phosphotransacetylase family protein|nr:AAA family ATPase [Puniceicoccales bacterium]